MGSCCCCGCILSESEIELTRPFTVTAHEAVELVSVNVNGNCDLIIKAQAPGGPIYLYATLANTVVKDALSAQQWMDQNVAGKTVVVERVTGVLKKDESYGIIPVNLYSEGKHINQELAVRGWAQWLRVGIE